MEGDKLTSREIRQKFFDFFKSKEHMQVDSAPMVLKNDATLMFTIAGMTQFKDIFLGDKEPFAPRVFDTQKCLRVSGKQNDLEEVGIDTYHHTMFEMLGNWSFGDYFKNEAIHWAWEFLVDVMGLPVDRLYVTVFEGDEKDGTQLDTEAESFWQEIVDETHILKFDKKDNFWEMGDTGPCGPCSEIHIDLRSEEEIKQVPGHTLVNADHEQVIEIWNLVFIQYNRFVDGSLKELPNKHIDTGMGLERLVRVVQGKASNYDSDLFMPLINFIAHESGKKYGADEKVDVAIRVISDHVRAVSFAIADGQLPSNTGAGYVIRRILRRAVRYAYTFLDIKSPFIFKLVEVLAKQFDGVFPEVTAQASFIAKVVEEEEASFLRTLATGIKMLGQIQINLEKSGTNVIDGKTAFELYDTYGFPLDLTSLIARENNCEVDEKGFDEEMTKQKERARNASQIEATDWTEVNKVNEVRFVGYDNEEYTASMVKYRSVQVKNKTTYQIVLDNTPFYAESGGQVGDKGTINFGDDTVAVFDTKKENDLIIHHCNKLPSDVNAQAIAKVDMSRRLDTNNNHSATHLLHAALQQVLGDHVAQKGSFVNDKVLRFDFSHFSKMTEEEINEVEQIVNEKIKQNIVLQEDRDLPIDTAIERGATALFGEKYGDKVRMITFDPSFSIELCGGTHVKSTADIGIFKILSESSTAAGVRRIEAITGNEASAYLNHKASQLDEIAALLKNPKDVLKSIQGLLQEKSDLNKQVEQFKIAAAGNLRKELESEVKSLNGLNVLIKEVEVSDADSLKQISFELKNKIDNLVLILAANAGGKPMVAVMFADNLVKELSLHAGKLVKELAANIKGGGGGQPFFATAGGKDISGLPKVIDAAKAYIENLKEEA